MTWWPTWWADMARAVEAAGHDRFSAEWYAAMRDEYRQRYPDADPRSLANVDAMAGGVVDA